MKKEHVLLLILVIFFGILIYIANTSTSKLGKHIEDLFKKQEQRIERIMRERNGY